MTLAEINSCDKERFAEAVRGIFDGGAGVPQAIERAWRKRPFASFDDLSTKLIQEVQAAAPEEQLALLRATRTREGTTPGDLAEKYRKRFGFPFIYAVKDGTAPETEIAEALHRRLKSTPEQEFQIALGNVFRVARFRLEEIVTRG